MSGNMLKHGVAVVQCCGKGVLRRKPVRDTDNSGRHLLADAPRNRIRAVQIAFDETTAVQKQDACPWWLLTMGAVNAGRNLPIRTRGFAWEKVVSPSCQEGTGAPAVNHIRASRCAVRRQTHPFAHYV